MIEVMVERTRAMRAEVGLIGEAPSGLEPDLGRTYDDFQIGQRFRHWPGRTVSEADNSWFTLLTMNTHPIHFDASFAETQEFGRIVVNSCLTLSIVVGMSVRDISQRGIANLGWGDVRLSNPVFVGDTLYAASEVIGKRESTSRPDAGILSVLTTGEKATGEQVISFERTILMPRKGDN